jgi:trk system potassium uptake protein TrkH
MQSAASQSAAPPTLAGWLFPMYLAVIFIGYMVLRTPGAMYAGGEMGKVRALFTVVNAATLTGFQQTIRLDGYPPLGQVSIMFMMLCGSVFTLTIGGCAVSRILRLGYSDKDVLRAVLLTETVAIFIGAFFLLFNRERTIWQAVLLAASSFANAGLFAGPPPAGDNWQTPLVILPLIVFGGLGICVLMELADKFRGRKRFLSSHAQTVIAATACIYLAGTILIGVLNASGTLDSTGWAEQFANGSVATIASRTAGLGLVDPEKMSRAATWIVMLLMSIGAASGSAAGGIKVNTLVEIFRGVRSALRGRPVPRSFGIAATWLGIYGLLLLTTLILLLRAMPQTPADRVLFLAVSAASNVGLSHEALSPDPLAAYILCGAMIIGRFAPLMVLWWMADSIPPAADETQLAVG